MDIYRQGYKGNIYKGYIQEHKGYIKGNKGYVYIYRDTVDTRYVYI